MRSQRRAHGDAKGGPVSPAARRVATLPPQAGTASPTHGHARHGRCARVAARPPTPRRPAPRHPPPRRRPRPKAEPPPRHPWHRRAHDAAVRSRRPSFPPPPSPRGPWPTHIVARVAQRPPLGGQVGEDAHADRLRLGHPRPAVRDARRRRGEEVGGGQQRRPLVHGACAVCAGGGGRGSGGQQARRCRRRGSSARAAADDAAAGGHTAAVATVSRWSATKFAPMPTAGVPSAVTNTLE